MRSRSEEQEEKEKVQTISPIDYNGKDHNPDFEVSLPGFKEI